MISSKQSRNLLFLFVAYIFIQSICAFQSSSRAPWQRILQGRGMIATSKISTISCSSTRARQEEKVDGETSFLMKPFTTTSGEIVNPYKILNVSRQAERKEIRKAYRNISKRYHPDIVLHKDVLPGNCNNHDDVQREWERIQISYNILSDKKKRMQYDRHEVIADPASAMQRALVGAAVAGVMEIGKGIFNVGSSAFTHIIGENQKTKE